MNEKWVADEIMALKKGGSIPAATKTTRGGVIVGSGLNVTSDGTISVSGVQKYRVNVTQATGGNITLSGSNPFESGSDVVITITPETGKQVTALLIDGSSVGAVTTYTIAGIDNDHTVTATYGTQQFTVTASVTGGHGSITANPTTVDYNGSSLITLTPDATYHVKSFKINGVETAIVGLTHTITNIQANQTVVVEYIDAVTGSFYIDKTELATSPTTCVHYNDGLTQAEAYSIVMDWIKPTVVKDGAIQYDLMKSDLSKKSDGTAATLTGADGDVMVSIKPIYWKVLTNDASKLEIKISDASFDGAITAHKWNGTVASWLHLGMFDMTGSAANSIYSTSAQPWTNMTNDAARTTAEAKGDKYGTMTYLSWELYQLLCVFASGSCNSQETIGQDLTSGSKSAVATAAMLTANGYTSSTKTSASTQLMYLFLACPWGNVYQWVSGLKVSDSTTGIATDQADARGVSVSAAIPSTWKTFTTPSTSTYGKEVQGISEGVFYPKTSGGSSSTYYCDYFYTASGTYCGYVGGAYSDGAYAGLFSCYVNYSSSRSPGSLGARLQCVEM